MILVPQLNPLTLQRAALLLMTNASTWSNVPPVARGVAVTASGPPSAAFVSRALQGYGVIKVSVENCF